MLDRLVMRSLALALAVGGLACGPASGPTPVVSTSPCSRELAMLQKARTAIESKDLEAALPLASALTCPAAHEEAAALRAEVEQGKALLAAPSIAGAQAELVRAGGLTGAARLRALSRTRLLLERVSGGTTIPVVLRDSILLPYLQRVETAKIAGTSFAVNASATLEDSGGTLMLDGIDVTRYHPEPTALRSFGAEWPLAVTGHYVRTGSGAQTLFADFGSEPPRMVTSDDRTFYLPDGSKRTVEEGDDVRLILPSGSPVVLDTKRNPVAIDDIAGRIITYNSLGPLRPTDTRVLELNVFDAKDGRRIARSTNPPPESASFPTVTVSADGSRLVVTTSSETSVFTVATGAWKQVGSYELENLAGGELGSAFTSDGSHVCAAWQDTFHVVPNDLPRNTDAVCAFEASSPFHREARIGCVEREKGWVATRGAARAVSIRGAAIATRVRRVAMLQNGAGVNPLPGGLMPAPEVPVRLVVANADTCKIERRIPLGTRVLESSATVAISADGTIVALSNEAFEVSTGKRTAWYADGMESSAARKARGSAAETIAAFGLETAPPARLKASRDDGVVWVVDASGKLTAWLIGSDQANRAVFFADDTYRFEGDFQRDAKCQIGSILAPIEVCPPPRDATDILTFHPRAPSTTQTAPAAAHH